MYRPRKGKWTATVTVGALVVALGVGCDSKTPTNTDTPVLSVSPAPLDFTAVEGGTVPARTFLVQNAATGTLNWAAVSSVAWLTITPAQGSAAAGESTSVTVAVNTAGLSADTHTATVTVSADGASNSPRSINATLQLLPDTVPRPIIGLASTSVAMGATVGGSDPNPVVLTVGNTGNAPLDDLTLGTVTYDAAASGWLAASLSGASAPASLSLAATVGSLAVGTYTAVVPIMSATARNSPLDLTVTFTVGEASTAIQLLPNLITFNAQQGVADPAAQTVQVVNPQGNTVDQLSVGAITYGSGASGWLTATLAGTTTDTELTLMATTGSLTVGSYTATVPIQSPVAGNSPQNAIVTFNVATPPAPSVQLSPSALNVTVDPGGADTVTVAITNGGVGDLGTLTLNPPDFGTDPGGWLSITNLSSSTVPATMTLIFDHVPALAGSTYTANFAVDATGGASAVMQATITMTGTPPIPPQVTASNFGGSSLVRIDQGVDFWIDFDLSLDPATVNTSNVRFERFDPFSTAWIPVAFSINYNAGLNRIEMTNNNTLVEFRHDYRIVVTPGVTSTIGDGVANDTALPFQTVAVSQNFYYTIQSVGQGQNLGINGSNGCQLGAAQNWFFRLNPSGDYQMRRETTGDGFNLVAGTPPATCFMFNGPGGIPPADELWTFEGEGTFQGGTFGLNATNDSGRRLDASSAAGPSHELKVVGNDDQVWQFVRGAPKP